ncbi:MAG: hypothetical protein B7Y04_12715 [Gallionellales bacterium 24-53-125]|nr:MAG: hypothetical protein B7Y04_12715 [Gallionellales bacterium 24-53-125]
MRMFFSKTFGVFNMVNLRCNITTKLTKSSCSFKGDISLFSPINRLKILLILLTSFHQLLPPLEQKMMHNNYLNFLNRLHFAFCFITCAPMGRSIISLWDKNIAKLTDSTLIY